MRNVFDSMPALANPANIALSFQQGLETGRAAREEREVRGALASYAVNPDDPKAFQVLAQYRPELAIRIRDQQTKATQAAQAAELQRRAATGDRSAQAQLWGIDPDVADKISDNQRAALKEQADIVGSTALQISQLPEEARPAAWDTAMQRLATRFPEAAQYVGKYSPEELQGAIAEAKMVTEFFGLERPQYMAPPEGSALVNVRDPAAIREYNASVGSGTAPAQPKSKADFDALPPGATFIAPDGTTRIKPGGGGGNATGGFRP